MTTEPTILPDGSAFAVASFPLPKSHWLYQPRVYMPGHDEPVELPTPVLTHAERDRVVAAIRYAVRGATMCGKEIDFDPDALVQNAVYALCGPFTKRTEPAAPQPAQPAAQAVAPWAEADAVALAHRAGFAGTCWTMGPEELVHLLNLTAAPAVAPPAVQPLTPLTMDQVWDAVHEADIDWHTGWAGDPMDVNRYLQLVRIVERAHGIGTLGGISGSNPKGEN